MLRGLRTPRHDRFGVALRANDSFRSSLAAGLTIVLAVQTLLIIGGVLRMLPLTGITLPFASYGGSSLLVNVLVVALPSPASLTRRTRRQACVGSPRLSPPRSPSRASGWRGW